MSAPEAVPVGDLEVADRIARAVRRGRPADRRPTLEQLLAAFGEAEPTTEARQRAARALALAGVATVPAVVQAEPGAPLALEVRGPRRRWAPVLGALALVAVLGVAVGLAALIGGDGGDSASKLPAGTRTTTAATAAPTSAAPKASTTTLATTTTTPTATTAPRPPATERRRRARARHARERRRRARALARRIVTVRLVASSPTFLCVDDGAGHQLFDGTLSGPRTFRARVVRLNVGLGPTTNVTANGRPVPLGGSPAGVEITPKGATPLPLGARPCA